MSLSSPTPGHRGRLALGALVLAVVSATGCSAGEPRSVGPAGVDGLEIPTPAPDPGDFVDEIDNPYLPLAPGSVWTYRDPAVGEETTTVSVDDETRTIAGVTTTVVTTRVTGGAGTATSTKLFAQDEVGNVWSFGGDDWQAGVDGAQAGLVMPAVPRIGDGFRQQYAPGVAEDTSMVTDTSASASTAYGTWTDLVEVRATSGVRTAAETTRYYARGVGLVLAETGVSTIELVSYEGAGAAP